jgi:hypothetical protein
MSANVPGANPPQTKIWLFPVENSPKNLISPRFCHLTARFASRKGQKPKPHAYVDPRCRSSTNQSQAGRI